MATTNTSPQKAISLLLKDKMAPIVGLCALVVFFLFIYYMLGRIETSEVEWARATYLFNGVEAIAFAAAGYFFGKEVHREQAKNAEKRATDAENRAIDAENKAVGANTKGKVLAEVIAAKAKAHLPKAERAETTYRTARPSAKKADVTSELTQADFKELKELAERLFQ